MLIQHWIDCGGKCRICFSLKQHVTGDYCSAVSCQICQDLRMSRCHKECTETNCLMCMTFKTITLHKHFKPKDGSLPLHFIDSRCTTHHCLDDCELCNHACREWRPKKKSTSLCRRRGCRLCSSPYVSSKDIDYVGKILW